jgi:16S rRNA (cytosine967-C5)-methyltransferase
LALGHPEWWLARWEERIGVEATQAWAVRNNEPKPLTIVQRNGAFDLTAMFEETERELVPAYAGGAAVAGSFECGSRTGDVALLPGFAEGAFWVQDAASTTVADLVDTAPGLRVLDACAGRGGKSFRLADRGCEVVACDRREDALEQLADEARRLGLSVTCRAHDWDAGCPEEWVSSFDAVLVDAPCSALGTMRRHPDIRWTRQPTDPLAMSIRQANLLETVAACVKPGGQLVYAVCSPEPEEGQEVADGFSQRTPFYRLERLWNSVPPQANEDAFFGARWTRGRPGEAD